MRTLCVCGLSELIERVCEIVIDFVCVFNFVEYFGPYGAHGPGPLGTYLYYFGVMRMKFGFGSAIGVVIFLICFTIALTYQRTLMRKD